MLYIDSIKYEILKRQIKVCDFTNNGIKGHSINIHLEFSNNNKKGYLNLDVGFEKDGDIMNFVNKEYSGIPFENDNQYIYFEVFDTEKFLDTEIESNIDLIITKVIDKKAFANFIVNDELIKIKFDGELDIINN